MPMNVSWNVSASVAGGASASIAQSVAIEAYDEIEVTLGAGDPEEEIEVQPGGTGQVQFLMITSSAYGAGLTYKVNATGNPSHDLDRPLVLAGDGAVGLLGFAPTSLLITNSLTSDATVQILVGRKAT